MKSDVICKESNVLNAKCCHLSQNFENDKNNDDNSGENFFADRIKSIEKNNSLDKNNEKR